MGRASSQGRKQDAWGAIRCPAAHRETMSEVGLAHMLGLAVPDKLLAVADEVIE
jgi:hypothetical protein